MKNNIKFKYTFDLIALSGIVFISLFFSDSYSQWTTYYTSPSTQHFECFFLNQNTGWIGGDQSKVFRTTNCGENWNVIYEPQTSDIIYCMHFSNELTGWAGTFMGSVLKTTNGGYNWTDIQAAYNKRIYDMFFINDNTGWCVGEEGTLRKTTNGGINWINPALNFMQDNLYSVQFLNSQTGYVCGLYHIARTSDGGINWNIDNYPQVYFTSLYFLNFNTGYALGGQLINNGNALALYVLKTNDGGLNWNVICSQTAYTGYYINVKDVYFLNENLGYFVGISGYMGPISSTNGIMYKTTNGGINWNSIYYYFPANVEALTFVNEQTGFATGGAGAVFKTTNGGQTVSINQSSEIQPENYYLFQNYPNPFNPSTKIKFLIPASGDGKLKMENGLTVLKVFNLLGKEIATLVNDKLQPGTYAS